MAKRCGLSQTMVSRIWRAFALQPHRVEGFKLSKDSLFIEKVRDLYSYFHGAGWIEDHGELRAKSSAPVLKHLAGGRCKKAPTGGGPGGRTRWAQQVGFSTAIAAVKLQL